ncbi:2,3-bisphosphoglycerate-dependent phosphoglycerate mutase [Candidatus Woesearchaeota archaeon]|jgi:2,3-bisphosphoglycerate-dependent phosphoglycerate mutase|nr:2,3-bisphosphoglycerate-dependent phosphoglycerate mutase [Candidatus Woesearchaeota archaeon]
MAKKGVYRIYLFRHGQTYFNRDHKFTGWKDSKLTNKGIKDAKQIAQKLKNKRIDLSYRTRLSRSKDTLKEVLKFHPECKEIIEDDRMIERSYGNLQGLNHTTIIKKFGKERFDIWHRSYNTPPPKGESVKVVEKRVNAFIKDLVKKIKKEKINIAISAHGNSMRPFRKYFEKLSINQMMKLENPWDNYFEYKIVC